MKIFLRSSRHGLCRTLWKSAIVAMFSMIALGGCSSGAKSVKAENPLKYDTLIIRSVVLKYAELEDDSSSNVAAYKAVQDQVLKTYTASVEEYVKPRNVFKTIIVSDDISDVQKYSNPLILETRFDKIVLGNRALRVARYVTAGIPLFGRGIMKIEASGRLLDGKSGKVITIENNDTNTSWDASSLEDNLLKMTRSMAEQYGEFALDRAASGEAFVLRDNEGWR